uniref:Uncharacterized protein n=1 Tax=uncultured Bacteroidota bacterium TaxID=152509 RepID=H5SG28_9BACT|nr:hypothetical protein HGMM_F23B02C53 [uncultured Bacteroidetes bacterium]
MHIAATLALFACTLPLLAQRDSTAKEDDSLSIDRGSVRIEFSVLLPDRLSALSFSAGYAWPSIDGSPQLSPATTLELEFGAQAARRVRHSTDVYRLEGTSISVAALVPELGFRDHSRAAVEGWRFGFRLASGHRFSALDRSGLYLLHAGGWTWSYVRPSTAPRNADSMTTAVALATADSYRTSHFGANTSATIGYSIGGIVTLEASYQRVLLYKNHVFFPWLGSLLLEGLAQSALSAALAGAQQRNPSAAAIATLVLRSALSWGIYQLRSTSGQHFPFKGNTPLLWDELRIGIGMQF